MSSSPLCWCLSACGFSLTVTPNGAGRWVRRLSPPILAAIAAVVGCIGGIYGIGGGSILAPVLIGSGRSPTEVAPATLTATFVTSVAGMVTFLVLSTNHHGSIAPENRSWGWGSRWWIYRCSPATTSL